MTISTAADTVSAWRDEIALELRETAGQLADCHSTLDRAEADFVQAQASWHTLRDFVIKGLHKNEDLAAGLHRRLQEARQSISDIEHTRGATRAKLAQLKEAEKALHGALAQAARMLDPDRAVSLRRPETASIPQPKLIDFDTIEARA